MCEYYKCVIVLQHLRLDCWCVSRGLGTFATLELVSLVSSERCSPSCLRHMDLHAGLCVCFCKQDVVTVYRTAVATFRLLASPMGTPLTCTASGEYLSHQVKR